MTPLAVPTQITLEYAAAVDFSLIIPVYKNEENIGPLVAALNSVIDGTDKAIEVIFVIDGSPDHSGLMLQQARDTFHFPSNIIFHSRNFGSFAAIRTGMLHAASDKIAVMAADLQEPPELILEFFEILENDEADVVFGQRTKRGDSLVRDLLSNLFWSLYRKMVIRDVPKGGVDVFACNRMAMEAVLSIEEPNSSLLAQLFWIGFRRKFVPYERRKREHGTSAWGFSRRMRYMMDSVFSFSDFPIIFVLWVGVAGCLLSFGFGLVVVAARLLGFITLPGYAGLAVLITFSTSLTLAVQGIIGSYLWRTFENTKRRPLSIISKMERRL